MGFLAAAAILATYLLPVFAATPFRVCVPALADADLANCTTVISSANTNDVTFSCVSRRTATECMEAVRDGYADIVNLDGGLVYDAWKGYDLRPIVSENYGGVNGVEYYAVAIVPEAFCQGGNKTLADLRDKNACMTGYGRTAGWKMPIGRMLATKAMPEVSQNSAVADDAESAAAFFNNVCAVANGNGPVLSLTGNRTQYPELCSGCRNTTNGNCNTTDAYWDYQGAFRGVVDGRCDVAFTKQTMLDEYVQGGRNAQFWSPRSADGYRLLCPQGGCATKDRVADCNMGVAPAHAFVVREAYSQFGVNESIGRQVQAALIARSSDADWRSRMIQLDLLEADTIGLDRQWLSALEDYLDKGVVSSFDALRNTTHTARFCVVTADEMRSCRTIINALQQYDASVNRPAGLFQWGCVQARSSPECLDYVKGGLADMRLLDAINTFEARILYNLRPLVREKYGEHSNDVEDGYYSVAVVNRETCETMGHDGTFDVDDLRNMSMCSTGYRTAAGWWAPLAILSDEGAIEAAPERQGVAPDAQAMESFFSRVCAPGLGEHGPLSDSYGNPFPWQPLCSACNNPLSCNVSDLYAGDQGPIRGLMGGRCDVAFTKHMMPLEYAADGTEAYESAEWGIPLRRKDQLRLVCSQGGCDNVDNYARCNLGMIPARVMVTWPDYPYRRELASLLVGASKVANVSEALFEETEGFWGELTSELVDITNRTIFDYLSSRIPVYQQLYSENWLGQLDSTGIQRDRTNVLVCVPAAANATFLSQCTTVMSRANNARESISFTCVSGGSVRGCLDMIDEGNADVTILDARDQYYAIDTYGIQPIVQEVYQSGRRYEDLSVAVVNSGFCSGSGNRTFADLRGRNACMTGYGKIAGWQLPIGYMAEQGIISGLANGTRAPAGVQPDAYIVGEWFGRVCAPDYNYNGPVFLSNGSTAVYDALCDGCPGGSCATSDSSDDEDGDEQEKAAECLVNGGDVAFLKYSAALNMDLPNNGGSMFSSEYGPGLNNSQKANLRLLCPRGGCAPLERVQGCYIDEVPARAIVGRSDLVGSNVAEALVNSAGALIQAGESLTGVEHFPFTDQVRGLALVMDWSREWGEDTHEILEAVEQLRRPTMRLCVTSAPAAALCANVVGPLNDDQPHVTFDCFLAQNGDCTAAVRDGSADFAILDSHDVWDAYKEDGLIAVAVEDEGEGSLEYYSVAVVRKETCTDANVTLSSLRDRNACFTGYQRTAGWIMPVGWMLYNQVIPLRAQSTDQQNDAESVAAFFNNTCAARVTNNGPTITRDGIGNTWSELCGACAGDCTTRDPYYDYAGSYRCLQDGRGDVVFTKHEVPLEYAVDGSDPPSWSTLMMSDLRLMCPNGGCAPVSSYKSCNFAGVPAHAVVVRPNTPDVRRVIAGLEDIAQNDAFASNVFNATANPNDLLFSAGVVALRPVYNTSQYFGPRATAAFEGFSQLSETLSSAGRR